MAPKAVATNLIEEVREKYGGSLEYESVAKNVAASASAGT